MRRRVYYEDMKSITVNKYERCPLTLRSDTGQPSSGRAEWPAIITAHLTSQFAEVRPRAHAHTVRTVYTMECRFQAQ